MSKISRSIVVAIFVTLIVFLGISDFVYINKIGNLTGTISNWIKIGYVLLIIVLISLYIYVREKLSRLKLQKFISILYRYIYISLVMLATTFFKVYKIMDMYPKRTLILYFILTFFIGLIVQRIIFNVSKSDVLSVLGMFISFTLPNIIDDKTINLNSKIIEFTLLISIYVLQILLDELKQLNIKNKKYIIQAIILGLCIGFSVLCGVNYLIWEIIAIVSIFITSNLDSTSLNLSNRQNKTIKRKKNNYFIYKIERIKISKLLISLSIVILISSIMYFGGRNLVRIMANNSNGVCGNIVRDLTVGIHANVDTSISNIKVQAYNFSSMSTRLYMCCYIYIIAMEILSIVLHRKYDTKSTVIKLCFVLLYTIITIFKLNVLYYQPVLTILLIIICIVNTTNIYYNREERIKMIEA